MNTEVPGDRLKTIKFWKSIFEWCTLGAFFLALVLFLFIHSGSLASLSVVLGFFALGIVCALISVMFIAKEKTVSDLSVGIPQPQGKLYGLLRVANWVAALAPFALLLDAVINFSSVTALLGFWGLMPIEAIAIFLNIYNLNRRYKETGRHEKLPGLMVVGIIGTVFIILCTGALLVALGGFIG